MTTIVYNGVILRDCEMKSFEQIIENDSSGTDLMFSRFMVRVASTLVATSYPLQSFGIDTPTGLTATQRAKDVHARLSEPRKDFWMLIESAVNNERLPTGVFNESLLTATGDLVSDDGTMPVYPNIGDGYFAGGATITRTSVVDVNNGPHPKRVSITEIIAGRSMRVEFEIEVCRKLCMPVYPDLKPSEEVWGPIDTSTTEILSNRWHLDESKDENWITTRVLDGTLRVKHKDTWPHLMRAICIPPLLKGYKRASQSFVDDPTGLVLKYRIEDRQAEAAPPYPAISWSGHHSETASGPNGSILGSEFSIRLTGPTGVDKVQLIGAAGKVAVDRIQGLVPNFVDGKRQSYSTILKNAAIVNILNEPTIEMRVQVQYTDPGFKSLSMRINSMGKPLTSLKQTSEPGEDQYDEQRYKVKEYDPRTWPVPLAYDSASPAGIFACYLQNPCSVWHDMPDGKAVATTTTRESVADSGPPDYHPSTIVHSPHALPTDTTYLRSMTSDNIYDFPYTFVDLESQYRFNNGWVQLPLANTAADAIRTARLIKLHGSVAQRVLTMTASRDGKMPLLPSLAEKTTDHNGIKEALNEMTITAKAPELLAGAQSRRFSVQAVYIYLLERSPRPSEKLRVGSTQLDKVLPVDNWINLGESVESGELQTPGSAW
jgi:hypothetical protein